MYDVCMYDDMMMYVCMMYESAGHVTGLMSAGSLVAAMM